MLHRFLRPLIGVVVLGLVPPVLHGLTASGEVQVWE
ncbi:MAG: hypothetical protein QG602_1962, partial [Verrucomicrobiota bacterium]|nr:hypothetical protein [Verrucomicrobiota bacterium]